MYDFRDNHGFVVHKYGPHAFRTNNPSLFEYIQRFSEWREYKLTCGAIWDGIYTPTPFNFSTLDAFYPPEKANLLKHKLTKAFFGRKNVPVTEVILHPDPDIRAYAEYLFENDYAPYTAKQWGLEPNEIDISVLQRVPLRFSYEEGYHEDAFQFMPANSYTVFFKNLLDHKNIHVDLGIEALTRMNLRGKEIELDGKILSIPVVYTGALDELFDCVYGKLPYRSLRFEWKYTEKDCFQPAPVVAYPKEKFTRITEYKKLPNQIGKGSSYAVEYSIPYQNGMKVEPYYPVPTAENHERYLKYKTQADKVTNLVYCGRLADYKYYYMDQALERALTIANCLN